MGLKNIRIVIIRGSGAPEVWSAGGHDLTGIVWLACDRGRIIAVQWSNLVVTRGRVVGVVLVWLSWKEESSLRGEELEIEGA